MQRLISPGGLIATTHIIILLIIAVDLNTIILLIIILDPAAVKGRLNPVNERKTQVVL